MFGRVVSGTNTLTLLNTFDGSRTPRTNYIVNANGAAGGPFGELPVLHFPTDTEDIFTLLIYCDVTLLNVKVARQTDGSRQITWNSVSTATNVVEYTTRFPPVWTPLTNIVRPTATNSVALDPSGEPNRFYRVRATY